MIGQIAIAFALPLFDDLGRSVTPIFLLTDHFLNRFSTGVWRINEENLSTKSLNFSENAPPNSIILTLRSTVSNASWRVKGAQPRCFELF